MSAGVSASLPHLYIPDTNAIVQALLQADRAPLTTLATWRDEIVARNEASSTIKSRISALQGSLTSLKLESSLNVVPFR
ncbi:MAG: flagellar cap protein FliD N-terminal domain-containing protein [Thermomicrobiales bacterium]